MDDQISKLSVVLPVYNGEDYLRQSIDSVLAQTYGQFELIIWNDGSSDATAQIVKSYSDRRISFHSNQANQGLFKTLNLAIKEARGQWIRLWSQDDVMKAHCLEKELAFLDRHPEVAMSYCAYDVVNQQGRVIRPAPEDATAEVIVSELAAQIMFYHGSITGNIANVMLKR